RHAGPADLEAALAAGRARLLALFDGFRRALGPDGLRIAQDPAVNLPLWELGHIGWFEEVWLARNTGRSRGADCDPLAARMPSLLPDADAFYDSSAVAHGGSRRTAPAAGCGRPRARPPGRPARRGASPGPPRPRPRAGPRPPL
ncbi:MAG: hypothetical protein EOP73_17590, partial [Variovorax sp.]